MSVGDELSERERFGRDSLDIRIVERVRALDAQDSEWCRRINAIGTLRPELVGDNQRQRQTKIGIESLRSGRRARHAVIARREMSMGRRACAEQEAARRPLRSGATCPMSAHLPGSFALHSRVLYSF